MTYEVITINGKLEEIMYKLCWILDRLFHLLIKALYQNSVSGVDKCPNYSRTADRHKLAVMGTVKAQLQLEQFSTKHK